MDRFDKEFHGVDRETSRPFSAGHPDGVWLASILYGLPVAGFLIGFAITLLMTLFTGSPGWKMVVTMLAALVVLSLLFAPIVTLLFRRSKKALPYSILLAVVFSVICLGTYIGQPQQIAVPAVLLVLQLFGVYYFWGLIKDRLLG